jgi:hypothetical protein
MEARSSDVLMNIRIARYSIIILYSVLVCGRKNIESLYHKEMVSV